MINITNLLVYYFLIVKEVKYLEGEDLFLSCKLGGNQVKDGEDCRQDESAILVYEYPLFWSFEGMSDAVDDLWEVEDIGEDAREPNDVLGNAIAPE